MRPASEPQSRAVRSRFQSQRGTPLSVAWEFFRVLVFLLLWRRLWLSQPSWVLATLLSFAIFSSRFLALALDWRIFSISAKPQLAQAFCSVLVSGLSPPRSILSQNSVSQQDAAIPAVCAMQLFRSSTLLSPTSPCESAVILLVSPKGCVFSSTSSLPLWLSELRWAISLASVMRQRLSHAVFLQIGPADFFPPHRLARGGRCPQSRRARVQLRAKGESAPLQPTVTERAARSTPKAFRFKLRVQRGQTQAM